MALGKRRQNSLRNFVMIGIIKALHMNVNAFRPH